MLLATALAAALVACSADRAELQPIPTTAPVAPATSGVPAESLVPTTTPAPATAPATSVRTTTTVARDPVGFAHCRVTTQGCLVEDPSPADVTAVELVLTPPPNLASLQYGPRPEQLADVYLPRGGPARLAIVYLHAGGWVAGGRADVPTTILHELDAHRAVISVGYRLTTDGPWPAQIQDVDRAIRWVKLHAADWGLDSRRVVVAGGSAGGHLALFAAVAPGHLPAADLPPELRAIDPKVAGVVSFAAPADIASLLDHEWGQHCSSAASAARATVMRRRSPMPRPRPT